MVEKIFTLTDNFNFMILDIADRHNLEMERKKSRTMYQKHRHALYVSYAWRSY